MTLVPTTKQQAIRDHDPGQHARVLAGPGTGKSATLTRRDIGPLGRVGTTLRLATTMQGGSAIGCRRARDAPSTFESRARAACRPRLHGRVWFAGVQSECGRFEH